MGNDIVQCDAHGRLKHFLTIEGMSRSLIVKILDYAESFIGVDQRSVKNVPLLRGKTVVNLFFEPSTRTRTTFEMATKRLSADLLSLNIKQSAECKGESLLDTLQTLQAMQCDLFVVRHANSGAAHFIAKNISASGHVINGGDGRHAHPTQAMLDMFTMRKHFNDFTGLRVAIIGDVLHSRVARSNIHALSILGVSEIRLIGPKTLIPDDVEALGVRVYYNMEQGLKNVDVIMILRLQWERMSSAFLPNAQEYYKCYGLTEERVGLADPNAIIMHPGPVNRGVEIDSAVLDSQQSVVLQQVHNGIAVRMAIMAMLLDKSSSDEDRVCV